MNGRPRVLVTGGAGYIGSHACLALSRAGYLPVALDSLVNGHESLVRWGPLEVVDVNDGPEVLRVIREHRPVGVLHFAAFAYVGESVSDPGRYYRNNVSGGLALLDAVMEAGLEHIVVSSTCAVYGVPDAVPISESAEPKPVNPYGTSKLMLERILLDYERAYGLRHMALRYFNAAGADPGGLTGELHDPETHLVPLAIEAALGRRETLHVFGTDYPTRDGTAIRDYVHVSDLAAAHVAALERLIAGADSCHLNLGTGCGYSVREVVEAVERSAGAAVPITESPRREGDPPELVADANTARRALGWEPRLSDLENIVASALSWHRQLQ